MYGSGNLTNPTTTAGEKLKNKKIGATVIVAGWMFRKMPSGAAEPIKRIRQ